MPEKQVFSIDTMINTVGIMDQTTRNDWFVVKDRTLEDYRMNDSEVPRW